MNKEKAIKKRIAFYIDYIDECIKYGSYETARLHTENMAKFIKRLEDDTERWCEEHQTWEEK